MTDKKYIEIFSNRLTVQRTTHYHKAALREVIEAVKLDMTKELMPSRLMAEIKKRDDMISKLDRKLSLFNSIKRYQSWPLPGIPSGRKIYGHPKSIKHLQKLIDDKET